MQIIRHSKSFKTNESACCWPHNIADCARSGMGLVQVVRIKVCFGICAHICQSTRRNDPEQSRILDHDSSLVTAIPTQARTGPEGSRRLKLPDFKTIGKAVSPTHRPPLPPRKYSWYSFLLEVQSTPGPQCGRKDYVNETFQSNPRPFGL